MRTLSIDRIGKLSDGELDRNMSEIKNLLSYNNTRNKKKLQIEYCYFQREKDSRVRRKKVHEEYMRNNSYR